jgi:transposase
MSEVGDSILKIAPSKERARVKKYVVDLTQDEREQLHKLISAGSASARMLNRARILLKADVGKHAEGEPLIDRQIAPMLETSTATVQRVRERFCRQGLDAALERSAPDRLYERSFDGRAEAHLIALACSQAPEGRERWSMRLLADKAVELGIVGSVSHETVRKTLKKTNCAPTWSRAG